MHLGQNVAKLRGLKRLTQKQMAAQLNMTQPEYSRVEGSEMIDDNLLIRIAETLDINAEAIKEFDDQAPIHIISSSFHDHSSVNQSSVLNFNPIDKLMEALEANKNLYERLLKEKDAVIAIQQNALKMYQGEK